MLLVLADLTSPLPPLHLQELLEIPSSHFPFPRPPEPTLRLALTHSQTILELDLLAAPRLLRQPGHFRLHVAKTVIRQCFVAHSFLFLSTESIGPAPAAFSAYRRNSPPPFSFNLDRSLEKSGASRADHRAVPFFRYRRARLPSAQDKTSYMSRQLCFFFFPFGLLLDIRPSVKPATEQARVLTTDVNCFPTTFDVWTVDSSTTRSYTLLSFSFPL